MPKHVLLVLAALFLVVLATVLVAVPVSAAEVRGLKDVNVASDEVIDDDLYVAGTTITIDGTVNGDLWAAGGTVNINGSIGGDVMVAGSTLTIGSMAVIGGDLLLAASTVYFDGVVYGYIRGSGDEVNLTGGVGGDVHLTADNLTVASTADIRGDLTYTSENEADIQAGAKILGETSHRQPGLKWPLWESVIPSVIGHLLNFLMILVIGIVIIVLAPKRMSLMSDTIRDRPWVSLGWGAIILFGTPIAFVMVCLTIVGIPLALIALVLYGIAIYLAQIPAALLVGHWLIGYFNKKDSKGLLVGALALGLAILCLLRLIPYAGWVIGLAVVLFGLGGALVSFKKR